MPHILNIETMDDAMNMIEILSHKRPVERIALAFRYFPVTKNMTHQDLADFVCMTREIITRTLLRIKKL